MDEHLNMFIDNYFNKHIIRVTSDFELGRQHVEPWVQHQAKEANKVLVDLILEYLNSDHWSRKFPKIFFKLVIKPEITDDLKEKRTIIGAPYVSWPYPDWGTSCYHINTYTGDMGLMWVLPMVETAEELKQYCTDLNPASTPEMRRSIRRVLDGSLRKAADDYNENHPYQDLIDQMFPEGFTKKE